MLRSLLSKAKSALQRITSSIAFYPSAILLGHLVLAFVLINTDQYDIMQEAGDYLKFVLINDANTARSILSVTIGGLISLMVFSFSMVMIIVNQASSNYSPRLIPGLISEKGNQIVLGFYLGTIVFNLFVLMSILPTDQQEINHGIAIQVGTLLSIFCLALFIYFIHTISTTIQISHILEQIIKSSKQRLEVIIEDQVTYDAGPELEDNYNSILCEAGGYYQGIVSSRFVELANEWQSHLFIHPFKGQHILKGEPLISYHADLGDEQVEELLSLTQFSHTVCGG